MYMFPDFSVTVYLLSGDMEFFDVPFGPRITAPVPGSKTE